MLPKWIKVTYKKNKTIIFFLVVIVVYEMTSFDENYILENIALIAREPKEYSKHDPGNYSCPYVRHYERHTLRVAQYTSFYWTERQKYSVEILRNYSPIFTLMFGGIYSDKYGGHRVVLLGMVLCSLVMSTLYLSSLNNNYLFIAMVALRRSSHGIIWAAFCSLVGKIAVPHHRTTYISIFFAGESFGGFLAFMVTRVLVKWKAISIFSGFACFVTAVWWWTIYKRAQFPKVRRVARIPWKEVMTSISLYSICFLDISCFLIRFIVVSEYDVYAKQVLFYRANPEWIIKFPLLLTYIFSHVFCGVASDYIISKSYLSVSVVRKTFIIMAFVTLFCTLMVIKVAKCDRVVVVGCAIALHFAESVAWSTTVTAILDFAPLWSGAVTAIVYTFALSLKLPLYSILFDAFVSGYSKGDINSWSALFFTVALLSLVFSIPFFCSTIKETSTSSGAPHHRKRHNFEVESIKSEDEKEGQQEILQDIDPAVSKRAKEFLQNTEPGPSNR